MSLIFVFIKPLPIIGHTISLCAWPSETNPFLKSLGKTYINMYFIYNVTRALNECKSTLFLSVHALGLFFLHGGDLVLPAEALRCSSYRRYERPVGNLLSPGRCPAPYQRHITTSQRWWRSTHWRHRNIAIECDVRYP